MEIMANNYFHITSRALLSFSRQLELYGRKKAAALATALCVREGA